MPTRARNELGELRTRDHADAQRLRLRIHAMDGAKSTQSGHLGVHSLGGKWFAQWWLFSA